MRDNENSNLMPPSKQFWNSQKPKGDDEKKKLSNFLLHSPHVELEVADLCD